MQRPLQEVGEHLALRRLLLLLVREDVGEAGDRVRVAALGVHDRDPEVLGHLRGAAPAPAAVVLSERGEDELPAWFLSAANVSLFCIAYASST